MGGEEDHLRSLPNSLPALSDGYLKERAGDLRTLGQRLLFHLDDSIQGPNTWPERIVLVADELSATTLAEVPQDRLAGVVVRDGAANSHAAIMVRALGIPTVMGADIQPSLLHGHTLIVDGYRGELLVDPEPVLLQEYQRLISEENELSRLAEDDLERASELKSGERVKVMLNAGLSPEHEEKLGNFVDGIGLYRTEIPFMLQSGFPSEEEQVAQYQGMLQMFNEKSVTLRTLDIGADKQLPYMPISEENPCLGWRGIRITLDQPEIFLVQVRAMLRANAATGNLSILLPMVTSLDEVDEARRLIDRASREVEEMIGYAIPRPRLGVMLEVPSMVFMLPQLANRVNFYLRWHQRPDPVHSGGGSQQYPGRQYVRQPASGRTAGAGDDCPRRRAFWYRPAPVRRNGGRSDVRDDPDWYGLSSSVDERSLGGESEVSAAAHRYQ